MSVFIGYPSFMAYQMMKGKKDNNEGFPTIPGTIARYSALGLTNEEMSKNPVWVDKTGNGHDLQMKNFAWGGMSGVNGYVQNFNYFRNNATVDKVRIDEQSSNSIKVTILTTRIGNAIYIVKSVYQFNKSYFIKISSEGYNEGDLSLSFYAPSTSTATTVKVPLNPNGITEITAIKEDDFLAVYLDVGGKVGSITIEQLPLYPGFILGDGVDDFAVTEKELNFEDTYTVYTAFIPFQDDPVRAMEMCGKDFKKDFYLYYSNTHIVYYTSGLNNYIPVRINQFHIIVCKRNKTNAVIKNLITGESKTFSVSELIDNPGVYYLWRYQRSGTSTAKSAIAGQTICNGYFSTDEDDEKVLDWYKKQYPWLFPDQAWTVVGKTNEDEDRATIANITGNSNDLVLSNFGFAEGSGYGLYYQYFGNEFKATNGEIEGGGWNIIDNYNISHDKRIPINSIGKCFWGNKALVNGIKLRFKLTGMTEGDVLAFGYAATYDLTYTSDGIYAIDLPPVDKPYGFSLQSSLTENLPTTPVTIELLPFEYEGYLVTDGVDDKAVSKQFKFGENFTVILDFKFPVKKISYCGFDLSSKVRIQNLQGSGVYVVLKGNKTLIPSNVVRAVTSEGKVYDENWNEYNIVPGNISSNYTMVNLGFDGSNQFAESATKLAGIYSSTLSKDECIKAYNYLQTLKAK